MSEPDDKTQALARQAQETARRMRRRPDAVFDLERPEDVVPLLPVQELLFAIEEIGVGDATDLVSLTTPEQLQSLLDLSLWQRDRVDLDATADWLGMLQELEPSDLQRKVRALDAELVGTVLRQYVVFRELDEEDRERGGLGGWRTPDTFYEVLPKPPLDPDTGEIEPDWDPREDARFPLAVAFLGKVYEADQELGRTLILEALGGTLAEVEELAYRWRSGRVADLGYQTYADALDILQFVDPTRLLRDMLGPDPVAVPPDPTDPATLGGVLLEPYLPGSETAFLDACLDALEPDVRDRVTQGFTFLANRVAAATLVQPGDADAMREVLTRARRALNLGLDYLARRDETQAPLVFERLSVSVVFRVGHSLTLQLQRLVSTLHQKGRLSLARTGATLMEGPWLSLVEGLGRRFPEVTRAFDHEPAPGFRPLLTLDDLAHTAALVEDLAAQWPLCFLGLRFDARYLTAEGLEGCQPNAPGAVRLGDLFRTTVLRWLLGEPFNLAPLTPAQLEDAPPRLTERAADPEGFRQEVADRVRQRLEAVSLIAPARLERIVSVWMEPLVQGRIVGETLRKAPPRSHPR